MDFFIDIDLNQDDNTFYGWYLCGYKVKENNTLLKYCTDTALLTQLTIQDIKIYRNMLAEFGNTTLANGRTCFESELIARSAISKISSYIKK